jgi:hypothetical protein
LGSSLLVFVFAFFGILVVDGSVGLGFSFGSATVTAPPSEEPHESDTRKIGVSLIRSPRTYFLPLFALVPAFELETFVVACFCIFVVDGSLGRGGLLGLVSDTGSLRWKIGHESR